MGPYLPVANKYLVRRAFGRP